MEFRKQRTLTGEGDEAFFVENRLELGIEGSIGNDKEKQ